MAACYLYEKKKNIENKNKIIKNKLTHKQKKLNLLAKLKTCFCNLIMFFFLILIN